jgi:tetratricopeptide (TPR) repeat protein
VIYHRFVRGICFILLLLPSVALADDVDNEIARRHFEAGRVYYASGDYLHALEEFEAARKVAPLPAFEFNVGRCHDRLEHPAEAVAAYERYLAAAPDAADAPEVRTRVQLLKQRTHPAPLPAAALPAAAPTEKPRRRWVLGVSLGVTAAVLAAVAIGLGVGLTRDPYTLGTIRSTQ